MVAGPRQTDQSQLWIGTLPGWRLRRLPPFLRLACSRAASWQVWATLAIRCGSAAD